MARQVIHKLISILIYPIKIIGFLLGLICSSKILTICRLIFDAYYYGFYSRRFKYFGRKSKIFKMEAFLNLDHIYVGNNTVIEKGALLRCFISSDNKIGEISIGNNVNLGLNANISSCNNIEIRDGVLTGRNVMINDNSHGDTKSHIDLLGYPINRPIVSKGSIIIEENVWIGENVVILGNVIVGHNSIIGANSVVTRDIPPFSIIGGVPAKIIKCYEKKI